MGTNRLYLRAEEARLRNTRLWWALAAYAILALLAYLTLDGAFRVMIWLFCGGLAIMTLARARYGEER
jgi:hypothetical protein